MAIGGDFGKAGDVEVASLDPTQSPLPSYLDDLNAFPHRIVGGAGGTTPSSEYICAIKSKFISKR